MIYCRFQTGGGAAYGILEDHAVWEVTPDIFSDFEKTGKSWPLGDVQLLAPCVPSKIVAVGLNYKEHVSEFGRAAVPQEPVIFLKATSALIGLDAAIVLPAGVGRVDYEAELAVVIKKTARRVSEALALEYVLGCTAMNDVTARDLQIKDVQWARSKSYDSFAPLGPWIADSLPYQNLRIEAYLNQKPVQIGHTSQMIFPVAKLVSYISDVMTLNPGDVITTGTPAGIGPIQAGDIIEIFVEGVGRLRNSVRAS